MLPTTSSISALDRATGAEFFPALVKHIAAATPVDLVAVAQLRNDSASQLESIATNTSLGEHCAAALQFTTADPASDWLHVHCSAVSPAMLTRALVLRDALGRPLGAIILGAMGPIPAAAISRCEDLAGRATAELRGRELQRQLTLLHEAASAGPDLATRMRAITRNLARALRVRWALVARLDDHRAGWARTIAMWNQDHFESEYVYALAGTPCADVHANHACMVSDGVADKYPDDHWLADVGARSYLGLPMVDHTGLSVAHISTLHDAALPAGLVHSPIFRTFAAQATATLLAHRAEQQRALAERAMLERQRQQSLELFASGVAHDLNNLLTTILGHTALARHHALAAPSLVGSHLGHIESSATAAGELAARLQQYAGLRPPTKASTAPDAMFGDLKGLGESTCGRAATVTYHRRPPLPNINGDAAALRQVALNLIVNARDALPSDNGQLQISLTRSDEARADLLDPVFGGHLADGPYVVLTIEDNGHGMDEQTLRHLFDPFYSTRGEGRGLGLAAVCGIVRAHRGSLRVRSSPGHGARFSLFLPIAAKHEHIDDAS